MNPSFDREGSSGCESGWTSYFEHEDSFLSSYRNQKSGNNYIRIDEDDDDDDEEDLSMVSDASSGPPHFCDEKYYGNELSSNALYIHAPSAATLNDGKSKKKHKHDPRPNYVHKQHISFLDDTASSNDNLALSNNQPFTDNMLDLSLHGHSSNQLEGKSRFQEHYSFCMQVSCIRNKTAKRTVD